MTPEERAKRVMFGDNAPFMDDDILTASHGYIISYPQLVAAIREAEKAAVKAEREACVDMIEKKAGNWPSGSVARMVLRGVAAAIRERPL